MLRASLLVFIAGWMYWFWLDKGPAGVGLLPPVRDGAYLENFQLFFNLLRIGRVEAGFVYIWEAHYLVLSLGLGLLLWLLLDAVRGLWRRGRLRRLYAPPRRTRGADAQRERDV